MRLSGYLLPTQRETPSDAVLMSHQLMLRAGLVSAESAGIYTWMPLGLRLLKKIEKIIRSEHEQAGIIELLMPTMQPADLWHQSGRYDNYGPEMLRTTDRHKRELVYGPTNEEMMTSIAKRNLKSYRDLPLILYHIQWKFRDEIRPRHGVMRGREFLMKDAYSFALTYEEATAQYEKMLVCYLKIFERMGLKAIPARAPTGPIGGDLSHEFHVLTDTGESKLYYHEDHHKLTCHDDARKHLALYAREEELHQAQEIAQDKLRVSNAIEAGHIFYFGDKYSRAMDFTLQNQKGEDIHPLMGSYGIGISRLVGALIEASHDDKGIIWHESIAPFTYAILNLSQGDETCDALSDQLYRQLQDAQLDVLYDDRPLRAGVKFGDMELIGIPFLILVGAKNASSQKVEFKTRKDNTLTLMTTEALMTKVTS